jgi:hypothetical protein
MKQENEADRGAGAGEVSVERIENTGFPGLGFSRQGEIAAGASQGRSPQKNSTSEDQDLATGFILDRNRESEMEIPGDRGLVIKS